MFRPSHEAVETFMRITGASESLALRKLEEYRGNISAAVNSHFSEGYSHNPLNAPTSPQHYNGNVNGQSQGGQQGIVPLLNAARNFRLSSLLDPTYRRHLFNQIRGSSSVRPSSSTSQPGAMGPVPPEFNRSPTQLPHLAQRPTFEDENHTSSSSSWEVQNDIEDEMLKAAIEASKQHSSDLEHFERSHQNEDDDFARAVSLSLRMAEQERKVREMQVENKDKELASKLGRHGHSSLEPEASATECKGDTRYHHQRETDAFYSEEWGGITSKELNESILLEAALFDGVPERSSDNSLPASHLQTGQIQGLSTSRNLHPIPCPLPSLTTQKETGRVLATQEDSFPTEPKRNGKDAVSLLLRLPDGRRHECQFFKSDKLQLLFKFIDDKLDMKPRTYRVVKPYPRCAFGVNDGLMTLGELGLTGKQEALFLELIE